MDIPPKFAEALKLPTGSYYTPKVAKIKPHEAILVRMNMALTNATSEVPVIGTKAFNPCVAIILYNKKTQTGVLRHSIGPSGKEFEQLLAMVRGNEKDQVDIHIIGRPIVTKEDGFCSVASYNQDTIYEFTDILNAIEESKNVYLKTFDVWDKPKPHAVAIDTRNGNLIRGSKLFKTQETADSNIRSNETNLLVDNWDVKGEYEDFDGTIPELQKQKRR